ncbi:MAG: response regulator transcription factor [Endomicrobiales bacterium]|nr:response regulator transcription factor [Endomicrobiales bacterium]
MNELIAIIEDEADISELVSIHLKKTGYKPFKFEDAKSFFRHIAKKKPDLIILDLMLPDADGFEVCKTLKKDERYSHIPVIMLTAKGEETDKIVGLEIGADDYVTKPFSPKELVARVKTVLRRNSGKKETEGARRIQVGRNVVVDLDKYSVELNNKKISLTTTEFKILELLASNKEKVFTRDQILNHLWGQEKIVVDRTIDVHIRHLREKLGSSANLIKNIRGVGYKLEE